MPLLFCVPVNLHQVPVEVTRYLYRVLDTTPVQRLLLEQGELAGGGQRVADLAAVHLVAGQFVHVGDDVVRINFLVIGAQDIDEIAPDLAAARGVEGWVVQGELDAGFEGLVEGADAVGCQDQNAVIILKGAEKHWISVSRCLQGSCLQIALPDTRLLRSRSCKDLSSRKTSASSSKRTKRESTLCKRKGTSEPSMYRNSISFPSAEPS